MRVQRNQTDYTNWLARAIAVMAGVSVLVALLSNGLLYRAAYKQESTRLIELVKSQAILINAVAAFEAEHYRKDHPNDFGDATMAQVETAHRNYPGVGATGEFMLGTRQGDQIVFLLSHRHFDFADPVPIAWESDLGEPMRRALRGQSGVMEGLDYRGARVLAAFEPLPLLNAGIVAKIDLAEIRAPFLRVGLFALLGGVALVAIGAMVIRRISAPLIERERALTDVRLLSHAVEQSPNMILITDTQGTIQYVNPCFTELTGYEANEVIGENPRLLKSGETPRAVYEELWRALKAGQTWRGEIQDRCKDGSVFWASMVVAPVKSHTGEITHFISIHEDITEYKLAEESTRAARRQAEVANRAKSEIMANTSHELRTPLNAIIGFSAAMNENIFGPIGNAKYEEYARYIHGAGEHLLAIINDILDVAAVEAGKLELREDEVNLVDIVENAVAIIKPKAEEGRVTVTGLEHKDLPPIVVDARRFKQIYLNLLSNAVKFTPEGGAVLCDANVHRDGTLVLTVTDTGIGMDSDGIAKAMTEFGQVDGSHTRKHEGTGLGLPLTKGLVEAHGGTLSLASEPGRGTTITIVLPAVRVMEDRAARTHLTPA